MPKLLLVLLLSLSLLEMVGVRGADAATIIQTYEILPGNTVNACGGFTGGCNLISIEGTISFEFDSGLPEGGTVQMVEFDVTSGGSTPFPFYAVLTLQPMTDFPGTIAASTFQFSDSSDSEFDWTFGQIGTELGDTLFMTGFYHVTGCCDFPSYDILTPVSLELVPEPSTSLLVTTGLILMAAKRRRASPSPPIIPS